MRMRKMVPLVLISSFSMLILIQCAKKRLPYDYVNPFIGTSGDHGQLFPGALLPYGMVKLSPDTYPSAVNKQAHSGYNYLDEKIMGFSHVRLGGEGCSGAGGNILVLPSVAAKSIDRKSVV